MIEKYKLIRSECIEEMGKIEDKSIDMILCDLPYDMTSCRWDNGISLWRLWEQYTRIIKENGAIVLFCQEPFTSKLIQSNNKGFRYKWFWIKNNKTGSLNAKKQPLRKVEEIAVFSNESPIYYPQGIVKLDKPILNKKTDTKRKIDEYIYNPRAKDNTKTGRLVGILNQDLHKRR